MARVKAGRELKAGTRVRLHAPSHVLRLAVDTGTIVGPDEWEDYYIIRLDRPALYRRADGTFEELLEVRELVDNLTILRSFR